MSSRYVGHVIGSEDGFLTLDEAWDDFLQQFVRIIRDTDRSQEIQWRLRPKITYDADFDTDYRKYRVTARITVFPATT